MQDHAQSGEYQVKMAFQPGDIQFINNYHVLHGREPYRDDRAAGQIRHLKRLWLETEVLKERPGQFVNRLSEFWSRDLKISRMDVSPA
jgi:alpha-ketoglutarate-dependent taurine dioxygenase